MLIRKHKNVERRKHHGQNAMAVMRFKKAGKCLQVLIGEERQRDKGRMKVGMEALPGGCQVMFVPASQHS